MQLSDFTYYDIPVQPVYDRFLEDNGVRLSILRLDLVHPLISGNKWFKLKFNLQQALESGKKTILSFGGAWSNHLHALAHAGALFGFNTIGIVRGELDGTLTPCLQDAERAGMTLQGIPRQRYAHKEDKSLLADLEQEHGDFFLVPEGGANRAGAAGCSEINTLYSHDDFDYICLACGTGTTLTGLLQTATSPVLGFQVLKGSGYLENEVRRQLAEYGFEARTSWSVNDQFHFGGYARSNCQLMKFIQDFKVCTGIELEPVYSGKMVYGIYELIKKRDFFPQNCSILSIHGGGLQGLRGYL